MKKGDKMSVQELRHLNELRAREAAQEVLDEAEMLDPVVKGVRRFGTMGWVAVAPERINWRWQRVWKGVWAWLRKIFAVRRGE
jgi:hypothetical protein